MKKLLGFMFGYGARGTGPLGWGTRLSQPDHLYHQGRNFLSMVLYGLFLMALFLPLTFVAGFVSGFFSSIGYSWVGTSLAVSIAVFAMLPMFYLSFAAIKLTILRLHDFDLSGWWILYSLILGVADFCLDTMLPAFTVFVSVQSLTYLGLLLLPASPEANKYGVASTNSTDAKRRWIRIVPLVLWGASWLVGMLGAAATVYVAHKTAAMHTEISTEQAYLNNLSERLSNGPTSVSSTMHLPTKE